MAKVNIQDAVAAYHNMAARMGMEMHEFHCRWHKQNPDPGCPEGTNADWGCDNPFGWRFLQMHHEMVKATADERKYFMHHGSIVSWFHEQNYDLPNEWDPLTPIPAELAFNPADDTLKRSNEDPQFQLANYFTLQGINPGEAPERTTGATKLADFKNLNQLGCCLSFPHRQWHLRIGGAMSNMKTAIDDPIFYFGVHWHIDNVFDLYKSIAEEDKNLRRTIPFHRFTEKECRGFKTMKELGMLRC